MEKWKDVKGYEGYYKISNLGNLKSLKRYVIKKNGITYPTKERIMSHVKDGSGYHFCYLKKDGKRKAHKIHRLVCEAFLKNPENKSQVNHKDCNIHNNVLSNLEWVTPKENVIHSWKNNRCKGKLGIDNNAHKLTEEEVREIKNLQGKKFSRETGKMYNVSKTVILNIWKGKSWTHIK